MEVIKKEKFFLFHSIENLQEFENELFSDEKYNQKSIIVDLGESIDDAEFKIIQTLSDKYKEFGMSFVVRITQYDADSIAENLSVAPTLVEAEDIIFMEDLERELGF